MSNSDGPRRILAAFDEGGLFVYQAFCPEIVDAALARGTFGRGFNLERMTWIKPSFGWMLYRSGYATKHNQERILRIKLTHEGFRAILGEAVPTSYNPFLFADEFAWRAALKRSRVRYQWDPDRDLSLRPLPRRAIQVGIEGEMVRKYVNDWIIGLEDATPQAHAIRAALKAREPLPEVSGETEYAVDEGLARRLGMCPQEKD